MTFLLQNFDLFLFLSFLLQMARTKYTARKSTCGHLPPRVRELTLGTELHDAFRSWRDAAESELQRQQQEEGRQLADPEEEEEDPEEREWMNSESEREEQQLEERQ